MPSSTDTSKESEMGMYVVFTAYDSAGKILGDCASGGRGLYDDFFDDSPIILPYLNSMQASMLMLVVEANKDEEYEDAYVTYHDAKALYDLVVYLRSVLLNNAEKLPLIHRLEAADSIWYSMVEIEDGGELYTISGNHRNDAHRNELLVRIGRGSYWDLKEYEWIPVRRQVIYRGREISVRTETMYEQYSEELSEILAVSRLACKADGRVEVSCAL
jgi:hypothetical protein